MFWWFTHLNRWVLNDKMDEAIHFTLRHKPSKFFQHYAKGGEAIGEN